MTRTRLIPRLDVKGKNLIKGIHLEGLRVIGDPQEYARKYYEQGADELLYVDVVASLYGRNSLHEIVRRAAQDVFVPLTVTGGLRSTDDVREMLRAGADKVGINTAAVTNPAFVAEASSKFGAQCIVVAIDARQVSTDPPRWEVFTHGGRKPTGLDAVEWAARMAAAGAGESLLTSMDRDGTRDGYDVALTRAVADAVPIPVIASGGVGGLDDLVDGIRGGHADAVLAASIFHFGEHTVGAAKRRLAEAGIEVRL